MNTITVVTLSCGHAPGFRHAPPVKGDELWCLSCDAVAIVVEAPEEVRTVCRVCTYGRKYGRAKETAYRDAIKHARKTAHIVRVYDGQTLLRELGAGQSAINLDALPQDPPY